MNSNGSEEDREQEEQKLKAGSIIFMKYLNKENNEVELDVDLIIPPSERLGKKVVELKNIGSKAWR